MNDATLVAMSSLLSSKSKNMSVRTAVCTVIRNRIVACVHWCSPRDIMFGLRGGDTLLVNLEEDGKGGKGLLLTEHLLRDAAIFQVLWNGIMQTNSFEKANLALCSVDITGTRKEREDIIISVDSEGVLRVWNSRSRNCVAQASLSQVLKDKIVFQNLEGKSSLCYNADERYLSSRARARFLFSARLTPISSRSFG